MEAFSRQELQTGLLLFKGRCMYYIIFKKHFKGGRVGDGGIDDGALLVTSPTTFWTLITRLFMSFYFTFISLLYHFYNPKNGLLYIYF